MVQLAEGAINLVASVEHVTVLVVAIREFVGDERRGAVEPAPVHHSTKAVQADVLIARIASRLPALGDVREIHSRLRMARLTTVLKPR